MMHEPMRTYRYWNIFSKLILYVSLSFTVFWPFFKRRNWTHWVSLGCKYLIRSLDLVAVVFIIESPTNISLESKITFVVPSHDCWGSFVYYDVCEECLGGNKSRDFAMLRKTSVTRVANPCTPLCKEELFACTEQRGSSLWIKMSCHHNCVVPCSTQLMHVDFARKNEITWPNFWG